MLPTRAYAPAKPLRLGHILVFTPDVSASVDFVTRAFGMGLADRAQDVIAITDAHHSQLDLRGQIEVLTDCHGWGRLEAYLQSLQST